MYGTGPWGPFSRPPSESPTTLAAARFKDSLQDTKVTREGPPGTVNFGQRS